MRKCNILSNLVSIVLIFNTINAIGQNISAATNQATTATTGQHTPVFANTMDDWPKTLPELTSLRNHYTRQYQNADGSIAAVISSAPIHYLKDGMFEAINPLIVPVNSSEYPYENTTNLMETYFGRSSKMGIKSVQAGAAIQEFLNTKMYWERGGIETQTIWSADVPVQAVQNKAVYENLFGRIGAEFTITAAKRELNYVIPDANALGSIPSGADFLVFSEEVILPQGWSYQISPRGGIALIDPNGKSTYTYQHPLSKDAATELTENNTLMEVQQDGQVLIVLTKVRTTWLLSAERQFPVYVDPTSTCTPDASTYRTAQVNSGGGGGYGNIAVGYSGGYYRGYASFDITAIPDAATVSNIQLYHTVYTTTGMIGRGSEIRAFLNDPEGAGYPTWADVYNGIANGANSPLIYTTVTNLNSNGQKNVALGANANTHLQAALTGTDKFTIGYRPYGSYTASPARYALIRGEDTPATQPYIIVTYTSSSPPSCTSYISPTNGITNAASGNLLTWNSAGGASSYDVFFGTAPSPSLAGNSLTTSFNPGCLEPNTTYYWKVEPKNANGNATGCATWSFTTGGQLSIYAQNFDGFTQGMFSEITPQDGWQANTTADQSGYGDRNVWSCHTYAGRSINGNSIGISAYAVNAPVATGELAYYDDINTDRWLFRPVATTNLKNVTINFRYRVGGEANLDFGSVIYNPSGLDPKNAVNWYEDPAQGGNNNDNKFYNQASPTYESILLPDEADNNPNLYIAFRWTSNNNASSSYPSFTVDDIVVSGCPSGGSIYPLVSTFNAPNSATLTLSNTHSCAKYQWEQAASPGGPWSNVSGGSGATTNAYTTGTVNTTTYYRCNVYYGSCTPSYQANVAVVQIMSQALTQLHNYGGTDQLAFNNSRNSTDSPVFRLSHNLVAGVAYQIEMNTAADFTGTSWIQTFNGAYPANTQGNLTFTSASGALTNGTTYYVRARVAEAVNLWGLWTSETFSYTFNTATTSADWFQTVQPQFLTDILAGTEANLAGNVVVPPGGDPLVNGTFANNSGWNTYKTSGTGATISVSNSDCFNCPPGTTRNLKMYLWVSSVLNNDMMIVSQQVDLTNVDSISFNAGSYYGPNSSNPGGAISSLRFIIGGTATNDAGTVEHTTAQAYCPTYCSNDINDPNITVNTTGYTGVHTVKFVVRFTQTHSTAGLLAFYVNNVVAHSNQVGATGTITSTPIYLASKQSGTEWDKLIWNQTLNGGSVVLKMQKSVANVWTDIAGLNSIAIAGNGLKTQDISTIGLGVDSVRVVATMSGVTSPVLHDWSVSAKGCDIGTWLGTLSTDWSTAGNWSCNVVPNEFTAVTIPSGKPNYPDMSGVFTAKVASIDIQANASVKFSGGATLQVHGNITNSGLANCSNGGILQFSGSGTQTLTGYVSSGTTSINKATGSVAVSAGSVLDIYDVLALELGTLDIQAGANVKLKSSSSKTAYVDDFDGSGNTNPSTGITGNLTIERYIPVTINNNAPFAYLNRYHFIGALTGGTASKWVGQFNFGIQGAITNYSTTVTPMSGCLRTFLDGASAYSALLAYDESKVNGDCDLAGWLPLTGTAATPRGKGFTARINDASVINPQRILSESGSYANTAISLNGLSITAANNTDDPGGVYGGAYNTKGGHIVSNPFWAPIDWSKVASVNGGNNLDASMYLYDPAQGIFIPVNNLSAPSERIVATNAAFTVRPLDPNQSSFAINFPVNARVSSANNEFLEEKPLDEYTMKITVSSANQESDYTRLVFNNQFSASYDNGYDAVKLFSSAGVPSIYTRAVNNQRLSIQALPKVAAPVHIPLGVAIEYNGMHTLTIEGIEGYYAHCLIWLEDLKTGAVQYIELNNVYSFTANKSDNADRFVLHFIPELNIASIKADCNNENGSIIITERGGVDWKYTLKNQAGQIVASNSLNNTQTVINNLKAGNYELEVMNQMSHYQKTRIVQIGSEMLAAGTLNVSKTLLDVNEIVQVNAEAAQNAQQFRIDMGDGTVYQQSLTAAHAYQEPGIYTISFKSENAQCASETITNVQVSGTIASTIMTDATGWMEVRANRNELYFKQLLSKDVLKTQVDVFNLLGQKIISTLVNAPFGQTQILSLGEVAMGTYIVRVSANGRMMSEKVIVAESKY